MAKGITFENNSAKVIEALRSASAKGITKACLVVEGQAKALAPVAAVRGGTLRDSITHKLDVSGGKLDGVVGTPIEYGPFVEYGTYKMGARPYLIPAFRMNRQNIINILMNDIRSGVGK